MTVAIPEAASVAEGIIIPGSSTYETYGTRRLGSKGKGATDRQKAARAARRRAAGQAAGQAAGAYAGTARGVARDASIPGDRSYQPVILAEFLIAVVLVAFTPIATGGSPNAKAKNSPSPYDVGDLRQLVAVGAVYFVLSLISSGNRGRISAWLGGLIVIGIGMTKLSKGQLGSLVQGITGQAVTPASPSNQQGWATDPFGNTTDGGGAAGGAKAA